MGQSHPIAPKNQLDELCNYYTRDEGILLDELIHMCRLSPSDQQKIEENAHRYVSHLRSDKSNEQLIDTFLQEYGLSTNEGLTLMRLAEALIRTPDFGTGRILMRDKLSDGDWSRHAQQSDNFWVNQATSGLRLTKQWIKKSGGVSASNLAARLGDRAMGLGVARAMALMGEHFVLGRDIKEAEIRARKSQKAGFTHSYDMLGEAAHTENDAQRYFEAYLTAIKELDTSAESGKSIANTAGISVKLSALHPRYEYAKQDECVPVLVKRLVELAKIAKRKNLGVTIDAEEADRLEVSLIIFEHLLQHPDLADWDGLGIVIQSYQRRATRVISRVIEDAKSAGRKVTVRLVKGAYWDMEIKRAQELGLPSYPVFTRKENTDISYIACARLLLDATDTVYPQFATHNALTASTIMYMASPNAKYEFQRLHGMGEALYTGLMSQLGVRCRIYAPVGNHKDLLPYLVRRLLENGANSSFVNQLFDETISIEDIVESPFKLAAEADMAANDLIPAPLDLFDGRRKSAAGLDITQSNIAHRLHTLVDMFEPYRATSLISGEASKSKPITIYNPANPKQSVGTYLPASIADIDQAISAANKSDWSLGFTADERARCLEKAADLLEERMYDFLKLCTLEAGKTYLDGVAEVREAIDFCRYYAHQARSERVSSRHPIGTIACISPWNFPLAIFLGQITASLCVGNTVIAKPAEQTPLIAHKAISLLFEAGIPEDAVHLIMGDGAVLGSHLTAHSGIQGVCFTGSTATAKKIAVNLADTGRSTIPFIAETGGINAMIIDSTALLEQAVQDVVQSAFQSTGQRCSACRMVCVQDDIADDFIDMLSGAMSTLQLGNPALLSTDIGPIIDASAHKTIAVYVEDMKSQYKIIGQSHISSKGNHERFIAPMAFEINSVSDLDREIFGPILHVVRFKASRFDKTIKDINALGFGLTMGLHSRLDERVHWVSQSAKVGNLYVNRNQIGAVVGVQPFGGEGLSGTGPKAGGPLYLLRLSSRSPVTKKSLPANENSLFDETIAPVSQNITSMIEQGKKSSQAWIGKHSIAERRRRLESIFRSRFDWKDDFWTQLHCDINETLPGPTGESNVLSLHPRGIIVCIGETAAILKQAALALYAGNSVITVSNLESQNIIDLSKAISADFNLPNLLQSVDLENLSGVLSGAIDGVAVDGDLRSDVGQFLCKKPGAIVPILSSLSDPERFFHERTVTINTTAAGGNATLLTLS